MLGIIGETARRRDGETVLRLAYLPAAGCWSY
jgi:hypothetical protein